MRLVLASITLTAGLMCSINGYAQAPAGAPAGSTGLCKDGSYYSGATKQGACANHGGVKDWYGAAAATPAPSATTKTTAPAAAPAAAATTPAAPPKKTAATTPAAAPAPGGGPGQVWVNTSSKVYHCAGSKYYGKTKQGEYMTEAAAKSAGAHADHGKSCS